MLLPTSQGGALVTTPEGQPWIEEYPSATASLVLNGFMLNLVSLWEYVKFNPSDAQAAKVLQEGTKALKADIMTYDIGSWTIYDRYNPLIATSDYMEYHAKLLPLVARVFNDDYYNQLALKWGAYLFSDTKTSSVQMDSGNLLGPANVKTITYTKVTPTTNPTDPRYNKYIPYSEQIVFKKAVTADSLVLRLSKMYLAPKNVKIYADLNNKWELVKPKQNYIQFGEDTFKFPSKAFQGLKITCDTAVPNLFTEWNVILHKSSQNDTWHMFDTYVSPIIKSSNVSLNVTINSQKMATGDRILLYRGADSEAALKTTEWQSVDSMNGLDTGTVQSKGMFNEFKVIY